MSMGDYKNFNVQHMLQVLSMRYDVLYSLAVAKGVTNPDMLRALRWMSASYLNAHLYFPSSEGILAPDGTVTTRHLANTVKTYTVAYEGHTNEGRAYRVKIPTPEGAGRVTQGMFSGDRGTSSNNTNLNLGYMEVASEYVQPRFGQFAVDEHRTHEGDDIWVSNKNVVWAALVYDTLQRQNMQFQAVKQLHSKRGEFLRVLYTDEGAQGYLCRALASWVTAQLLETSGSDIVSRLEEIQATAATCYRRGARVEGLIELVRLLNRRASVLVAEIDGRHVKVRMNMKGLDSGHITGGIDLGAPGTVPAESQQVYVIPRLGRAEPADINALPGKMSGSQASHDLKAMDISGESAGAMRMAYK